MKRNPSLPLNPISNCRFPEHGGLLLATMCFLALGLWMPRANAQTIPGVIIDQDLSSDHDDVADCAAINALANAGQCKLLACMTDSQNAATPLCQNAICTYFGNPNVPCGIPSNLGGVGGYPGQIAVEFPHPLYQTASQCPLAVNLYRQILASQPDHSVVIVTTGFLNNLQDLLQSGSDGYSSLTGSQLVAQKVKLWSCAGGQYPSGGEFNFTVVPAAAYYVVNNWPAPVTCTGFEVGGPIGTAADIASAPRTSPMRRVWELFTYAFPWGAYSAWGQVADIVGTRGAEDGLYNLYNTGRNNCNPDGTNFWSAVTPPATEAYLLETERYPMIQSINAALNSIPSTQASPPPAQPSNMSAAAVSGSQINLAWDSNAYNATGYQIERRNNSTGVYAIIATVGNVTSYSDTTVSSTTNVAYRVKATNANGSSKYSYAFLYSGWTETNFDNPTALPLYTYYHSCNLDWPSTKGGASHVTVNNDSTHGQNLAISVEVGTQGNQGSWYIYFFYQDKNDWYRLNVSGTASQFEKAINGTISIIGTTGSGINMGNGTMLQLWQVNVTPGRLQFSANGSQYLNVTDTFAYGTGKIGLGGWGNTPLWQNFYFDTTASVVNGLSATAGNNQVSLSWSGVSGAASYNVYRCVGEGDVQLESTPIATVAGTSYTDTTGPNSTDSNIGGDDITYYYQVAAVTASGTCGLSNEASALPPGPPPPPMGLNAQGGSGVVLSWDPSSSAVAPTTVNIYRGTTPGGESSTPIATGITTNGYTDGATIPGATYYYTIAGVNSYGTGSTWGEASATTTGAGGPPVITSLTTADGMVSLAFNYTITATNAPTSFNVTGLPSPLSLNTSTGLISGTPTTAGTSTLSINAINSQGTGTATLSLVVNPFSGPPVINSTLTAAGTVNSSFSYQIAASNNPNSFNAAGLPVGLSVNTSTGVISGTPTATGSSSVTIVAINASGTGSATLTLTVNPAGVPVINSPLVAMAVAGTLFSYQITATNSPSSYSATGLPASLSLNTATGLISGTASASGTDSVTIHATNNLGTAASTLDLTVYSAGSNLVANGSFETPTVNNYTYNPPGSGWTWIAQAGIEHNGGVYGAPNATDGTQSALIQLLDGTNAGMSQVINVTTPGAYFVSLQAAYRPYYLPVPFTVLIDGTATGTFTPASSSSFTSYVSNGYEITTTGSHTLEIVTSGTSLYSDQTDFIDSVIMSGGGGSLPPPYITSSLTAGNASAGSQFSYQITATNSPTSYNATNMPAGLSVNTITGIISGIPTASGTDAVTIFASNASGTGSATLTVVVAPAGTYAPVITSPLTAFVAIGHAFSYDVTATNNPASYNATGLPSGLSVNTNTGAITGTASTAGASSITITAIGIGGTGTATLALSVIPAVNGQLIWPVGDSITDGYDPAPGDPQGGGYRTEVYDRLISASVGFNYVGSWADNPSATLLAAGSPYTSHDGHDGWTTEEIDNNLNGNDGTPTNNGGFWIPGGHGTGRTPITPSIILLNIGTNDASAGKTAAQMFAALTTLLNDLKANLPNTQIFVSSLTPRLDSSSVSIIESQYNSLIATNLSSFGTNFHFVDLNSNFPTGTGVAPDGIHPNLIGYNWMGDQWANAIMTYMASSNTVPVIISAPTASIPVNYAFSYQTVATNSPTSYNATGLPLGLSINASTGLITGTPTTTSTNSVTLKAINGSGTGTTTLTLIVTPASVPSNLLSAAGNAEVTLLWAASTGATSYNVYRGTTAGGESAIPIATGITTANYSDNSGLSNGTTYYYKVAAVSTYGTSGYSNETSATPEAGGGSPAFVNPSFETPNVSSMGGGYEMNPAGAGWTFTYNAGIQANGSAYSGSGPVAPDGSQTAFLQGISSNSTNGFMTQSVGFSTGGTYTISFYAAQRYGSVQPVNITVDGASIGTYTPASVNYALFTTAPFTVTAGGHIITFAATDDTGDKTTFIDLVTISGTTGGAGVPVITSTLTAASAEGSAFSYQITASNSPTSYNATGLPAGLSVNTITGLISGTPATIGTSSVTIRAINASGTGTATLSLTVSPAGGGGAPVITSATTASATVGGAFNYQITATNSPNSYNTTELPSGLSVNTSTGLISGTPTASNDISVTISAANASGTGTATLTLTVNAAGSGNASIGVQFVGAGIALAGTQSAGVVAQTHWQPVTGSSFSSIPLMNNSGVSTTAMLNGSAYAPYVGGGSSALPPGNADLASGEIVNYWPGAPALTISGIPYAQYDIYFYAGIDAPGRSQTISVTPSGGSAQYYSFTTMGGGSAWIIATGTWNGTGTAPSLPSANYAHFAGLTASSFTVNWGATGNGGLNGIQIVQTGGGNAPATPASLTATGSNGQVTLDWTASSGATSYNVYQGTGSGGENVTPIATGITGTSSTITGLANGTTYYYKVAAVNSSGTSSYSNEANAVSGVSYSEWETAYFGGNLTTGSETATPLNDGVTNLLKFLFDIDPDRAMTASDFAAMPTVGTTTINGSTYITLTYRKNQEIQGAAPSLQSSTDLKSWTTVTPTSTVIIGNDPTTGDPLVQYQLLVNPTTTPKVFIRLNVTGP